MDAFNLDYIYLLHKAIYGLKQTPRAWFTLPSQALFDIGFQSTDADTSLIIYYTTDATLYVLIYVDDIVITGTNKVVTLSIIKQLQAFFAMKDLDDLRFFLRMQAHCDSTWLHIRQSKYILDLLHKSAMVGAKSYAAPTVSGSKLLTSTVDHLSESDTATYLQVVGALQYCTIIRPNIFYSVNQICQFMHSLDIVHCMATKRVLHYLKGSVDHGLFYRKGSISTEGFCDSDQANDLNSRRSTTGFSIFLA